MVFIALPVASGKQITIYVVVGCGVRVHRMDTLVHPLGLGATYGESCTFLEGFHAHAGNT